MESVDLAAGEHHRERLRRTDRLHLDIRRQLEADLLRPPRLLFSSGVVSYAVDGNTVVLGQNSTDPHRRSHLVLRRADAFAYQILRRVYVGVGVDVDARGPEAKRRKDGYGDE